MFDEVFGYRTPFILRRLHELRVVSLTFNLLDEHNIRCDVRTRVLCKEAVGNTHRSDNLAAMLRKVADKALVALVERACRGNERRHTARMDLVYRLGEEEIMYDKAVFLVIRIKRMFGAERNVGNGRVHEVVGHDHIFKSLDAHIRLGIERFQYLSRNLVQLDCRPARIRVVARAYEIADAGGRFKKASILQACA